MMKYINSIWVILKQKKKEEKKVVQIMQVFKSLALSSQNVHIKK